MDPKDLHSTNLKHGYQVRVSPLRFQSSVILDFLWVCVLGFRIHTALFIVSRLIRIMFQCFGRSCKEHLRMGGYTEEPWLSENVRQDQDPGATVSKVPQAQRVQVPIWKIFGAQFDCFFNTLGPNYASYRSTKPLVKKKTGPRSKPSPPNSATLPKP